MLEAGIRQHCKWRQTREGGHILIAVARYLAAHSPTERAQLQTADVARRLSRGYSLHGVAEGEDETLTPTVCYFRPRPGSPECC